MGFYQGKATGYGRAFMATVLAALKTAPADPLIDTGKLRFSKDPVYNPTPASAITDLTPLECDFSGYTAGGYAVTVPNPVVLNPSASGLVINQIAISTTASPYVPNQIYGWWIDDGANVIAYEAFAGGVPVNIGQPGDFIDLAAVLAFSLSVAILSA